MSQTRSGRCRYSQGEKAIKAAYAKRRHDRGVCDYRHQRRYHMLADLRGLGDDDVSVRFNSTTMYEHVPRLRQLVQNEMCFFRHDYT